MVSQSGLGQSETDFRVELVNFSGPFDLLLQLISKQQLDVTEVALSQVTDEFISYVKNLGPDWDLAEASSFILIAATLLDLKAARLLPSGAVTDPEDLAVLEARDLLFARLLQYRAYKEVSFWLADQFSKESLIFLRPGGLEDEYKNLLPEVVIPGGADRLARAAIKAFTPAVEPQMPLAQLHLPQVSVAHQAAIISDRLRSLGQVSFCTLVADADRLTTVARFLALLELFRESQVAFEQLIPLGELTIRWTGEAVGLIKISDEFDQGAKADE